MLVREDGAPNIDKAFETIFQVTDDWDPLQKSEMQKAFKYGFAACFRYLATLPDDEAKMNAVFDGIKEQLEGIG